MNFSMAKFTSEIVGTPYKLGKASKDEGFDCLSLILKVAEMKNVPIPEQFEGWTLENYARLFKENKKEAKRVFLRFVETLGNEVDPKFAFCGDILITKTKHSNEISIGIHGGGNLFLASFGKYGVELQNLDGYDIVKAYKWGDD